MHDVSGGIVSALCPCGSAFEGAVDLRRKAANAGQVHGLCGGCQSAIERHVQRRFGRHRYGGRLADRVGDFVQDCYVKLFGPGGIAGFRPPEEVEARSRAFRGWLWKAAHNHCNLTQQYWRRRFDELDGKGAGDTISPTPFITPEEAFTRDYCLAIIQSCIDEVRQAWERKGKGHRFNILFGFLSEDGSSYSDVATKLGVTENHAHGLVHELRSDLKRARIEAVRNTLDLPPGLDPLEEARRIEEEIRDLMQPVRKPDPDQETEQPE